MFNNLNENSDVTSDISSKAVELASLVGSYFSKENLHDLLEEDFKLLKKLKRGLEGLQDGSKEKVDTILDGEKVEYTKEKTSELEELLRKKEEEYKERRNEIKTAIDIYVKGELPEDIKFETNDKDNNFDLDILLNDKIDVDVLERIRKLYSNLNVRELYSSELEKRKDDFEILEDGKKGLAEVLKIEETVKKAEKFILGLKIKSFVTHKTLTPGQISKIKQIRNLIASEESKKQELLQSRETATSYRLRDLKRYRRELENEGFITFPSRQKIINKVIEKLVIGENILLSGPTGTGKTVLAIKALESLNIGYSDISGKTLADDIKAYNSGKKDKVNSEGREGTLRGKSGIVDKFAMILSGHSGITASEFIAKPALKGQIETTTELGKLLKAFVDGKVPIIDEIDLIPNDVLMRVKHLFTLKPGSEYAPQEDGNKRYTLHSTGIIATANIKSAKHPDREELDPAIIRLFKGVQVPYFTQSETNDLALVNLMEQGGFIYDVDKQALEKDGILYNLVKALKEIEDSYLGKGTGLSINVGGSDKSGIYLQKAILEIGNFASMFKGFKESGLGFKQFIKTEIAEFVSNGAYPVNDRLLLIKIFSQNGLIIMSDVSLLQERIVDISKDQLEKNIMGRDDIFTEGDVRFIDSYELANLDPYGIRNLSLLNLADKTKEQKIFIRLLSQKSIENTSNKTWDNIAEIADRLLEEIEKNSDFEIAEGDINTLGDLLWETKDVDLIKKFGDLGGVWLDKYNLLEENDEDKILTNTPISSHNSSEAGTENMSLTSFITSRRLLLLDQYKNNKKVSVNGATLDVSLSGSDKNKVESLDANDIKIENEKTVDINGENLSVSEVLINGISFMAIQVPEFLKGKKLRETYIGEQLAKNSDLGEDFLDQEINNDYIVYGKTYMKDRNGNNRVNISAYNTSADTDAVRECMKLGFNTSRIDYEIILGELIREHKDLGKECISFSGDKADEDEKGYEQKRIFIKKIEDIFGIDYGINTSNFSPRGYMLRDYGVYKNKNGRTYGFLRGSGASDGAVGGPVSLSLRCAADVSDVLVSFRPSV